MSHDDAVKRALDTVRVFVRRQFMSNEPSDGAARLAYVKRVTDVQNALDLIAERLREAPRA